MGLYQESGYLVLLSGQAYGACHQHVVASGEALGKPCNGVQTYIP